MSKVAILEHANNCKRWEAETARLVALDTESELKKEKLKIKLKEKRAKLCKKLQKEYEANVPQNVFVFS